MASGSEKATGTKGSEQEQMALMGDKATRVQEPLIGPYSLNYIYRMGGFPTSTAVACDNAPLMATSATDGSLAVRAGRMPCLPPPSVEGWFQRGTATMRPVTNVDNIHMPNNQGHQGNMARNRTCPGGATSLDISEAAAAQLA